MKSDGVVHVVTCGHPKSAKALLYDLMRMTVDLPDPLFCKLKALAARRGVPLKDVIQTAVEAEIRKAQNKNTRRVKFPLLPSSKPGTLNLINSDIEDLLS